MFLMLYYLNCCYKVCGLGWNGKILFFKYLFGWKFCIFVCFFVMLVCECGFGGLINFGIIYFIVRWLCLWYCIWNKCYLVYVSKKV